ncbi:MAG: hypothetical protein V4772_18580 [Pseudomonadota bacterium]
MIKKTLQTPSTLLTAALLIGMSVATGLTHAQTDLPLTGPAFEIADAAYKAYARGDYRAAAENAREALRLRPDVASLKTLLDKAEAASQARPQTQRNAGSTGRAAKPVAELSPPQPLTAPALIDPAARQAFDAADAAYKAYNLREFPLAAERAADAVRLAPANRDYRLLLVNSLLASDRLSEADAAINEALVQPVTDEAADTRFGRQLLVRQAEIKDSLRDRSAQALATAAYKSFENGDFARAAEGAGKAVELAPASRDYRQLQVSSLYAAGLYQQAGQAADATMATLPDLAKDPVFIVQRGFIRQRLGQDDLARQDFEAALGSGKLPVATEIGLLADLGHQQQARQRFDTANTSGELARLPPGEVAYLAVRVGEDAQALTYFRRADASGKLANTAYEDAAFAALRSRHDDQAIAYFKRTIDDAAALKLNMSPQLLFNTRRAVAEVSREWGLIASLSYRGAVSGLGINPNAGGDSLQGGVEAYWRPWGYQNGQYAEVFARAFQTLYSEGGGASGGDTLQAAVGMRYKPLAGQNLVLSFSRVISRSGGRNDWLAQLGYSAGRGTDLRVDVPSWWTTRVSAEAGRYLSAGQTYALGEVQAGKSFRLGDSGQAADGRWVLFPHLSLAADYDSAAAEKSAAGIGPGLTARYWFNEDFYNAPRSYVDFSVQYRARLAGARRAKGLFVTTTLSY